jgi:DHA1 family bicyclomycin/chloramphenicol resistance-like MFS transporter
VLATPVFLGEHLQFAPTQFFWFFCCTIGGIMAGAAVSGRLAGKVSQQDQIKLGFQVMAVMSAINIALNLWAPLSPWWALPVLGLFAFGWAIMVPVVTLMVLDQVPERRGMASSLQACVGSAANGLVAGALVPLVMHSTRALAFTSAGLMCIGLVAWAIVQKRLKT